MTIDILICSFTLDHAIQKQAVVIDPGKKLIDHAMEKQISLLEYQVASLKAENAVLKKENQKLIKTLNKRELNFIKIL